METPTATPSPTVCRSCGGRLIRWGKDRGFQRWRCKGCGATASDLPVRPLGSLRIDPERAALILGMLTEGSSIRSAERLTGTHRDTICRLLRVAGVKAEKALFSLIRAYSGPIRQPNPTSIRPPFRPQGGHPLRGEGGHLFRREGGHGSAIVGMGGRLAAGMSDAQGSDSVAS